nr:15737_t:CDS:1 [Entrophospora candida]
MNNHSLHITTRIHKFLRSDATPLTPEAIKEIRNAPGNIPNASRIMCKKHRIGMKRYKDIINNQIPSEPTDEWRCIIETVNDIKPKSNSSKLANLPESPNDITPRIDINPKSTNISIKKGGSKPKSILRKNETNQRDSHHSNISKPISNSISMSVNADNPTEKISREKMDVLYEQSIGRNEEYKAKMAYILNN